MVYFFVVFYCILFIRYYTEKIQGNSDLLSEFTLLETPLELKDLGQNFEEDFIKNSQNKTSIREFLKINLRILYN